MRKTVRTVCSIALALGLATAHAQGDPTSGAAAAGYGAVAPDRGLTMAQVEQRYGAPANRLGAVGQPPISRWVYPSFVVYFEYNLVIHAVATPAQAKN